MRTILTVFILVVMGTSFAGESDNPYVIVFVSFSMPSASLKGWMREAERAHAPVVMRGLVDNSFKETIKKLKGLVKDGQGGIQIDPLLFRKYQIKQVPAVVVRTTTNVYPCQACAEDYDVVYGNVHLDYALEKIAKQHDAVSDIAKAILSQAQGAR